MNISLLKRAAIESLALMLIVITSSYALKQYHLVTIEASSQDIAAGPEQQLPAEVTHTDTPADRVAAQTEEVELSSIEALRQSIDPAVRNLLSENFLMLKKPKGTGLTVELEDQYINRSILLNFTGIIEDAINSDMLFRVRGNDIFSGEPEYTEIVTIEVDEEEGTTEEVVTKDYGKDLCNGITITAKEGPTSELTTTQVQITLDSVYAYGLYEDNKYYYIDLKKPSDVYDRILVIDAGHGGKDAGALSKDKKHYEKNINLDVLLRLKELLDKENIKVYYTRTADDKVYLRPRVQLANAVDADYFISIHSNANESTSPNGFEVLYYDNEFKGVKAKNLAEVFSQELGKLVTLKQKGIVERNYEDIFIMDKAQVPTILIEMGYLTNKKDLNYLIKEENRQTIAQGIFNGIMRAYDELPVTE